MDSVNVFADMCIRKGYVTAERAPWLRYALEKRVMSILISVPVFVIGIILAPPVTAISFFFSFYLLRVRTNGFHASSALKCFILSLIGAGIFLGVLPLVLDSTMEFILLAISAILIYGLAPYNHPNMALTKEELAACARSAKRRLTVLLNVVILANIAHYWHLAEGIILGGAMTALTLALAYYAEWRKKREG